MDLDTLIFNDLEPIQIKVRINNQHYVLREASEDTARKWRNHIVNSARMIDGELAGMGNVADAESLLVSLCLYEAKEEGVLHTLSNGDPNPKYLVPLATIRRWPSRVVKPLAEKAKDISYLDEKVTVEALNKQIGVLTRKRDKLLVSTGQDTVGSQTSEYEGSEHSLSQSSASSNGSQNAGMEDVAKN